MRVVLIGFYMSKTEKAGLLAVPNAAMTHGHELDYLLVGVLSYCVNALTHGETLPSWFLSRGA